MFKLRVCVFQVDVASAAVSKAEEICGTIRIISRPPTNHKTKTAVMSQTTLDGHIAVSADERGSAPLGQGLTKEGGVLANMVQTNAGHNASQEGRVVPISHTEVKDLLLAGDAEKEKIEHMRGIVQVC